MRIKQITVEATINNKRFARIYVKPNGVHLELWLRSIASGIYRTLRKEILKGIEV